VKYEDGCSLLGLGGSSGEQNSLNQHGEVVRTTIHHNNTSSTQSPLVLRRMQAAGSFSLPIHSYLLFVNKLVSNEKFWCFVF